VTRRLSPPRLSRTLPVDTPEGTDTQPTQEEVDYQKRYTDLQAEYTRTRQQMTDPEYQQQVAQEWLTQHGYALPKTKTTSTSSLTRTKRSAASSMAQTVSNLTSSPEGRLDEQSLAKQFYNENPILDWIRGGQGDHDRPAGAGSDPQVPLRWLHVHRPGRAAR
jgi:hypothetical protein